MNRYRNFGYSLIGGGGALGSMLISRGCAGSCSGCLSCFTVPGIIAGLTLYKSLRRDKKGETHGLAANDH